MADRDWEKELAKVDKHLASISDEELAQPRPGTAVALPGDAAPRSAKDAARSSAPAAAPAEPRRTTGFGVYTRLTLSVLLGIAMIVWPYQARCGLGLSAYLAAVVVVVGSGVWSSVWTWRHRAARAHTLSLLIILWGLLLGSIEVLPRVGYAVPSVSHPAAWACR